jgi:hypothetical protein
MTNRQLIVSFTDQSESFTYGVEFGRLLQKMEQGDENVTNNGLPVRVENKQVLIQACESYGYLPMFSDSSVPDEWLEFSSMKISINDN